MWIQALSAIGALVLTFGFWAIYNQDVPKGFKSPWKLKFLFASSQLVKFVEEYVTRRVKKPEDAILLWKTRLRRWPSREIEALPVDVQTLMFDGVQVMLFRPKKLPAENNPGIVQFHGGGFTVLSTDFYQDYCRLLAHETSTIVASVEYRLAPEHIYPAALNDCYAAAIHFIHNAKTFGVDAHRIALLGDSAGGNLAAAVSLKLRDFNINPKPKLQVLVYPCLQAVDFLTPSCQNNEFHPFLQKASMVAYWLLYAVGHTKYQNEVMNNTHIQKNLRQSLLSGKLNHKIILSKYHNAQYQPEENNEENPTICQALEPIFMDPYFAPLMSEDLSNLPEALVVTVQDDVLRDDGIWYAEYLKTFGVRVTHVHYEAGFHCLDAWPFYFDENTKELHGIIHQHIRENL